MTTKSGGVVGMINNIDVKSRLSPTEVKSRIEEALRRSAELDARRITVAVDGSVGCDYSGLWGASILSPKLTGSP